ncbi:MAG: bile acid:sodium symporter family protein [Chthoniobacterales bacterium]|nr:bile acid:sodium symporter family protein [Chthoniobacterales bacterium]
MKELLLPVALFAILFGMGLSLRPADFLRVILSPKAKLVGLGCQLVLLPVVAFILALAFRLPGELAVGLMVLAACPGGATSNVITHLARGDTALSVTVTAISSVVCVFTIPWIIGISMDYFLGGAAAIRLPFWKTLAQLTAVTIVPIILGMALKGAQPALAARLARPANVFSLAFLAAIIVAAVLREDDLVHQFRVAGPAAITLNILTMSLGFAVGSLFGLPQAQKITIAIEAGIQNGTLALGISLGLLESARIAMPSVVYCLFMFLTGGCMIARYGRRTPLRPVS